jgi:small subunit ribosomal protein S6e
MVEFKVIVNDTKKGKSYQIPVAGHHANSLVGKKIGDEVDGIFVSLPGYKLRITGGTDKDGFPMRTDLPGSMRRRLLVSDSIGCHPKELGKRVKKSVRGNTVSQDTVQINMRVTKYSSKPIDQLVAPVAEKKDEEEKEAKREEPEETKKEGEGETEQA